MEKSRIHFVSCLRRGSLYQFTYLFEINCHLSISFATPWQYSRHVHDTADSRTNVLAQIELQLNDPAVPSLPRAHRSLAKIISRKSLGRSSPDVRTNLFDNESRKSTRTESRKCRGVTTTRLIGLTLPLLTGGPSHGPPVCNSRANETKIRPELLIIFSDPRDSAVFAGGKPTDPATTGRCVAFSFLSFTSSRDSDDSSTKSILPSSRGVRDGENRKRIANPINASRRLGKSPEVLLRR